MVEHHFLLISFPVQGHINPSLQFAKQLILLGAHVTFSTTLHMHRRMSNKPTIPSLSYSPFSDGYDLGFTATTDADRSLYLSEYTRRLSEFVTDSIASRTAKQGLPFTCLITTPFIPSAAKAARAFHIPTVLLWIQPATMFDIHYHYFHGYRDHINDKITKEPSSCSLELPGLPLFQPNRDLPSFYFDPSSNLNSLMIYIFEEQFLDLDQQETRPIVLLNTFEALEPEALRVVDKFDLKPIGPLIPSALLDEKDPSDSSFGGDIFRASNDYVEWLDSQAEDSVVYVSFGSFCVLPKKQMEEIARALLDCGCPFLWVIREREEKKRVEEKEEDAGELSCREELEQRGKIVKWCSQVEVLSHASLGCFVTHCGWNSTMESLVSGVPVVAFPQWLDQKTNAKLIEDVWKTGVRVDYKMNEEGMVEAEEIRMCLDAVMGSGEKGDQIRRNARKWKGLAREAVMEGGSSENNLRAFLEDIGQ